MKNLLLTGGCGFIGAAVCRHVLEQKPGWKLTVLDKLDVAGSLNRLADMKAQYPDRLRFFWHDLRAPINPVMLRADGPFDYVAHLAAASHVDRSIVDPPSFILDNVLGTAHLFEYVRHEHPRAKVLYKSTDEIFGPAPEGVAHDESSPWAPHNPYSAAKAGGEALCPAYANTFGMQIVVTHCTNVFGRTQYREKFVPLVTEKLMRGETIQIHARNGVPAKRFYLHVDDAANAVVTVLERGGVWCGAGTGQYHITGDTEYSNLWVAQQIAKVLNKELRYELVQDPPNRPRPDMRYCLDGSKLAALGWSPQVAFEDGLRDALGMK